MEITLVVMMIWCVALLWCSLKETKRHLQFVFTVVCLSGGILFLRGMLLLTNSFPLDSGDLNGADMRNTSVFSPLS